jgi:hypothetical protein
MVFKFRFPLTKPGPIHSILETFMKAKIITVAAIALLLTQGVSAMPPRGAPPIEPLVDALQLDESQTEQVRQVLKEQHDKVMAFHQEQRENRRKEMETIHQETIARLRTVLDEDQMNEFIEFTESRRRGRHSGFRHGPGRWNFGDANQ